MSDPRFWSDKEYQEFWERFSEYSQADIMDASLSIQDIILAAEQGNIDNIIEDKENWD